MSGNKEKHARWHTLPTGTGRLLGNPHNHCNSVYQPLAEVFWCLAVPCCSQQHGHAPAGGVPGGVISSGREEEGGDSRLRGPLRHRGHGCHSGWAHPRSACCYLALASRTPSAWQPSKSPSICPRLQGQYQWTCVPHSAEAANCQVGLQSPGAPPQPPGCPPSSMRCTVRGGPLLLGGPQAQQAAAGSLWPAGPEALQAGLANAHGIQAAG